MSHKINDLIVETISNAFTNKINEGKTDEEKRIIIEKLDSIDLEALVDKMISDAAKPVLKKMTKTMYEQVLDFRAEEEEFLAVQKQKWNKAFTTSEALYIMNLEFADSYKDVVNDLTKEEVQQKEWTFLSLQYIHGRALQVYLEIITLMKNGFADGAFARWRTIYELAIVSDFISTYGEETAKEFYESSESDDRYYDWAKISGAFGATHKGHIRFHDLEKKSNINVQSWAKQYQIANFAVHASPQGTFNRIGMPESKDRHIIPVGHTDYGIANVAVFAAVSLQQIVVMFGSLFGNADILLYNNVMHEWIDVIYNHYKEVHNSIFDIEEEKTHNN